MGNRAHRTLAISLTLTLTLAASALAAGPLKGRTYRGTTPTMGVDSEGHQHRVRATGISLRVAGNGKTVIVRFTTSGPLLFCNTTELVFSQITRPVSISRSGAFKTTIGEKFAAGPGAPAVTQIVSGRFYGHTVRGTIRTLPTECGGVTNFTASTR